jgi:putative chitinase
MIHVDAQTMREVAPTFSGELAERQHTIVTAVGEVLADTLARYDITTRLRIAHFLGQTCHESAGFRTTEEFASGDRYEGNRDLGNTKPGDGRRYKGRGLLQLTGRANYREFGAKLGIDLEGDPERAAEPVLSLTIACEYWKKKRINVACDRDDVVAVTRLINGGQNGLPDRRTLTAKAKAAVARLEGFQLTGEAPPTGGKPVLRRGSKGDAVVELQRLLQKLGFMVAVDGDFGAGTEVAVAAFQRAQKLGVDGIVGQGTWAALGAAAKKK